MPKNRILILAVTLNSCLIYSGLMAQNPYLELSGGLSVSSLHFLPRHIRAGINAQAGIGICPYIPEKRLIPIDTIGNARNSHPIIDENFRAYLCVSYTPKGETKLNINNQKVKGETYYFEIKPQGRYYIPLTPFYLGGGLYMGIAASKSLTHNGQRIKDIDPKDYYRTVDVGTIISGGCEVGVGHTRIVGEIAIEKGLFNVSKTSDKKHTFAILLNAGVSLTILDKYFKHY